MCDHCGGELKNIAAITDPRATTQILINLRLPAHAAALVQHVFYARFRFLALFALWRLGPPRPTIISVRFFPIGMSANRGNLHRSSHKQQRISFHLGDANAFVNSNSFLTDSKSGHLACLSFLSTYRSAPHVGAPVSMRRPTKGFPITASLHSAS